MKETILPVALCDDKSHYIEIENADKDKTYYCPCCGGIVYPKAIDSKYVSAHFCHKQNTCSGESIAHFLKKWEYTKKHTISEIGLDYDYADIEPEYRTSVGVYIPDVALHLPDGSVVFLEIKNTNGKSFDYILKWDEIGNDVIEFDIRTGEYCFLYKDHKCFCKYKNSTKEKSQIEILEYAKSNLLTKQRYSDLAMFWKMCREYMRNQDIKDIIALIQKMPEDDVVFVINELNKYSCDKYLMDNIEKEILMQIKQKYTTSCTAAILNSIYSDDYCPINNIFVCEYKDMLLRKGVKCLEAQNKASYLNGFLDYFDIPYNEINKRHIKQYKQYLYSEWGNSPKYIRAILQTIYSIWGQDHNVYNRLNKRTIFEWFDKLTCGYHLLAYDIKSVLLSKCFITLDKIGVTNKLFSVDKRIIKKWISDPDCLSVILSEYKNQYVDFLDRVEKDVFGESIFCDVFHDAISKEFCISEMARCIKFAQNGNLFDDYSNLVLFVKYEYDSGNSLGNIQNYIVLLLKFNNRWSEIKGMRDIIKGIYLCLSGGKNETD